MAPLHPIILRSVASVKDFLDKLIDIDHDIGEAESSEHTTKPVMKRKGGLSVELIGHRPAASVAADIRIKRNNTAAQW